MLMSTNRIGQNYQTRQSYPNKQLQSKQNLRFGALHWSYGEKEVQKIFSLEKINELIYGGVRSICMGKKGIMRFIGRTPEIEETVMQKATEIGCTPIHISNEMSDAVWEKQEDWYYKDAELLKKL